MTRSVKLVMAVALVLGLGGSAAAGDVAGTWTSEFDSQIGPQKYTFVFEVDGEKLTGTATGVRTNETSEVRITDGKVVGDKITFTENLDLQGQPLVIKYTGTLEGDEIHFKRNVADFVTEDIVAKRKKD
jgi:hypothetical protein